MAGTKTGHRFRVQRSEVQRLMQIRTAVLIFFNHFIMRAERIKDIAAGIIVADQVFCGSGETLNPEP